MKKFVQANELQTTCEKEKIRNLFEKVNWHNSDRIFNNLVNLHRLSSSNKHEGLMQGPGKVKTRARIWPFSFYLLNW